MNGKRKLSLTDFSSNSTRKQISKLKESINQINDCEMPIASYRAMQKKVILTKEEKKIIINWMNKAVDRLSVNN